MKPVSQFIVVFVLAAGITGCGSGADIRGAGAKTAVASLSNLRKLFDNLKTNATNAQDALKEFAKTPAAFAAMLLRPFKLPTNQKRTISSPASNFTECVSTAEVAACTTADFGGGCLAGDFTLTGSGKGCTSETCTGGKRYSGAMSVSLNTTIDGAPATGTFGVSIPEPGLCVTPAALNGSISYNVILSIPGQGLTNFNVTGTACSVTYCADGTPQNGALAVTGAGMFNGNALGGCAKATFTRTDCTSAAVGITVDGTCGC